jgi:PAS domain S-box-containing protein
MENTKAMVDPLIYRFLVEQVLDYAVFVLDKEGRVVTWNRGAAHIKGYTAEEIVGRHFSVFYPRDAVDSGWPEHELKVAAAEGRFEDEGWRIRKDGSRFWASVVITAMRDDIGKLMGFSKVTRDLTDRKLHEETLRQSEERFRVLVEGVTDYAIFMLDPEGVITSWNAGAERIKGYSHHEIIGQHFSRFYIPEDLDADKPWKELATARRIGRAEDEGWRLRKNGEHFWARVVITPLYDTHGHLLGFAKVTQDLTERRHIQDLEKAAKNVSEFIAMLAHELRNPLAPIRSAVHVMAKTPAGDLAHEAMRQTIDRQSSHLARILDDMVDISSVSRGTLRMDRETVDMNEVVRRAVEAATPLIETNKHILKIHLPEGPLSVQGDLHRLTQLLTNLLNNAARYTPEGGNITVRARAEEDWAVLKVRDTGRGIVPQMIEPIFGMFVQGRPPLQRVGGGLGVGLALARKLAELHGGSVTAHSEGENKGSEFTVRIPLSRVPQPSADKRASAAVVQPGVARRVLVVDDNVDAAATLEILLKSLGHETCAVHDGVAALKMVVEFHPDIVMLDIGMPGLDGYEVARRMNALKKEHTFRIVAITGWGQEADRAKSREAGFDLHLVKPVDLNDLARALSERDGATLH